MTTQQEDEKAGWARDSSTKCCIRCNINFSLLSRRHHCRSCGEIYCVNCSSYTNIVPNSPGDRKAKKRVCKVCHDVINEVVRHCSSLGNFPSQLDADAHRALVYASAMTSKAPTSLSFHMYSTHAANLFAELEALKEQLRGGGLATALSSSSLSGSPASPGRSSSLSPQSQFDESGNNTASFAQGPSTPFGNNSMALLVSETLMNYTAAGAAEANAELVIEYKQLSEHAINLLHVLKRKSLSTFFHFMYSQLLQVILNNKAVMQWPNVVKHTAPVKLHGMEYGTLIPAVTTALLTQIGVAGSTTSNDNNNNISSSSLASVEAAADATNPARISDLCFTTQQALQRAALVLTMRYEEQVCCLDEAGAESLAESCFGRFLIKSLRTTIVTTHFEDLLFSAVLSERLPSGEISICTRVQNINFAWTDHGALSQCGLKAEDGTHYDPPLIERSSGATEADQRGARASATTDTATSSGATLSPPLSKATAASTTSHNRAAANDAANAAASAGNINNNEVGKYYYRRGTRAEALALGMIKTDKRRHRPNPMRPLQDQFAEHQTLIAQRNFLYATFDGLEFAPYDTGCWINNTLSAQETIARAAIEKLNDYIANRERFYKFLVQKHEQHRNQIDDLDDQLSELHLMIDDVATGAYIGIETQGLIKSLEAMDESADPGLRYKVQLMQSTGRLLSNKDSPSQRLYLYLRLKLAAVVISVCFKSTAETQTLFGTAVPFSLKVQESMRRVVSNARMDATMHSWSDADIIARHCEPICRALAARYASPVSSLSEGAVVVFGDALVARVLYRLEHSGTDLVQQINSLSSLGSVQTEATLVRVTAIYLPTASGTSTLNENYIHSKAGLRVATGDRYVGLKDVQKVHFRPQKYGYLLAAPNEVQEKKLYPADENWTPLQQESQPQKKKSKFSLFFSRGQREQQIQPLLIKQKQPSVMHWPSSVVSAGPRLVSVGDKLGLTIQPRNRDAEPVKFVDEIEFRVLTTHDHLSFEEGGEAQFAADVEQGSAQQHQDEEETAVEKEKQGVETLSFVNNASITAKATQATEWKIFHRMKSFTSGELVVGAIFNGKMLVSNAVTVRSGPVEWEQEDDDDDEKAEEGNKKFKELRKKNVVCRLMDVQPRSCPAGDRMVATMTLRDAFGNLSSSMPGDFAIRIRNKEHDVVPSNVEARSDGKFRFSFVPIAAGEIEVSVAVGTTVYKFPEELECKPNIVDFKNSLLSFDEIETVAGHVVHGNLLLQDTFGNHVVGEDDDPIIEIINGDSALVPATKVQGGEYIFEFCPVRQGTAIIRATSAKSSDCVVGKISVLSPFAVSWANSAVSCMSEQIFAGETAIFHIMTRDEFGNLVDSGSVASDFSCSLMYEADGSPLDVLGSVTGAAPSYAFKARPTRTGGIRAVVTFAGEQKESPTIDVLPGTLCWEKSAVRLSPTARVGLWTSVEIECCDQFGNPTPAHGNDFAVAIVNNTGEGQVKKVEGAGSHFSLMFMATKTGVSQVSVTYAGHQKQVCDVLMTPAPFDWRTSLLSFETNTIVAGTPIVVTLHVHDEYGNPAHASSIPNVDGIRVLLQSAGATTTAAEEGKGDEGNHTSAENAIPYDEAKREETAATSGGGGSPAFVVRYVFVPTRAGHITGVAEYLDIRAAAQQSRQGQAPVRAMSSLLAADAQNTSFTANSTTNFNANNAENASFSGVEVSKKSIGTVEVLPAQVDWASCVVELSHAHSVIAGLPLSVTVYLFDVHKNPTTLEDPSDVNFVVINKSSSVAQDDEKKDETAAAGAGDGADGEDGVTTTVSSADLAYGAAIVQKTKVFVKVYPEAAGELHCTITYKSDEATRKITTCAVRNSAIDWLGKTLVEAPPRAVAGEEINLLVKLLDAFGNAVADTDDLDAFDAVVANKPKPAATMKMTLDEENASFLRLPCTFFVATEAVVVFRLQDAERPPLVIPVDPAPVHWASTSLEWHQDTIAAGIECCCELTYRDRFHNATSPKAIKRTRLEARVMPEQLAKSLVEACSPERQAEEGVEADDLKARFFTPDEHIRSTLKVQLSERGIPNVVFTPTKEGKYCLVMWRNPAAAAAATQAKEDDGDVDGDGGDSETEKEDPENDKVPFLPIISSTIVVVGNDAVWESTDVICISHAAQQEEPTVGITTTVKAVAGETVQIGLRLRDRFSNTATGFDVASKVKIEQVLSDEPSSFPITIEEFKKPPGGTTNATSGADAEAKEEEEEEELKRNLSDSVQDDGYGPLGFVEGSRWCVELRPTKVGRLVLKLEAAVNEEPEMFVVHILISPAAVMWPHRCMLSVDSATVIAGESIFFNLEMMDEFGNSTKKGYEVSDLKIKVLHSTAAAGAVSGTAADGGMPADHSSSEPHLHQASGDEAASTTPGDATPTPSQQHLHQQQQQHETMSSSSATPTATTTTTGSHHHHHHQKKKMALPTTDLMSLPHGEGCYGFSCEPTVTGFLECIVTAFTSRKDKCVLRCEEIIRVQPSAVSWSHSVLVPKDDAAVVGESAVFDFIFKDRFSNIVDEESCSPSDELKLVTVEAANNGHETQIALDHDNGTAVCTEPTHTGSLQVTASHMEDPDTQLTSLVDVISAGIATSTCHFGTSIEKLLNGVTLPTASGDSSNDDAVVALAGVKKRVFLTFKDKYDNPVSGLKADTDFVLSMRPAQEASGASTTQQDEDDDAKGGASTSVIYVPSAQITQVFFDNANEKAVCPTQIFSADVAYTVAHRVSLRAALQQQQAESSPSSTSSSSSCLGAMEFTVRPYRAHAKHSYFECKTEKKPRAGEPCHFRCFLFDEHGNKICDPSLIAASSSDATASSSSSLLVSFGATNGTVSDLELNVSASEMAQTGEILFDATPREAGELEITAFVQKGAEGDGGANSTARDKVTSHSVSVAPAPMHWPSTTIRVVDDVIKLGSETSLVISPKDRFGNPVTASATDFVVRVVNGDAEILIEALIGTKSLLATFKPLQRGRVYCEVRLASSTEENAESDQDVKTSNTAHVE